MKVYETERRRKRDYCNTLATQGKESVQTLDRMRKVKRKKVYQVRETSRLKKSERGKDRERE